MQQVLNIIKPITIPQMYRIAYHIESPRIENITKTFHSQLHTASVLKRVKKGQRIAIAVGSRGIANQPLIIKLLIEELKARGTFPFVIPAMGSHAGADAEGQKQMLERLGLTENYIGAPILSSMEVVQIGETRSGLPIYIDKNAYQADAIILANRVKTHTAFKGKIESGLIKMSVIGLGKQKGAEICHELGFEHMSERIAEIGHFTLSHLPVIFGVALIENAKHETAEIHVIPAENIEKVEEGLLKKANQLMARVPFKELEVLIIDQIGKDISGSGLDPNVIGRYHTGYGSGGPSITRISVLDITDVSHGNGNGLGIADFTTQRAYQKFDFAETYPNSLTSNVPLSVKIPMVLPNDQYAIQAALKTCFTLDKSKARLARIRDTVSLSELEISAGLLDEVHKNPRLEIIEGPYKLQFNADGNLF